MKKIILLGTLLLVFVLTAGAAGTASAQIILPPGWPFLPPIIITPEIEAPPPAYYPSPYGYYSYPEPYGYYAYPYSYYGFGGRGLGYWGHGGRWRGLGPGSGHWGHSGHGRGPVPGPGPGHGGHR